MPDNLNKVGVIAEVASAAAAVAYPLVKVVGHHLTRRRERLARRYGAAAAAVETRLIERCDGLEVRLAELEELVR